MRHWNEAHYRTATLILFVPLLLAIRSFVVLWT